MGVEYSASGGAGGWVGYRSVRKTSLLIECFVTPATQGVYRKTFAETMFRLNPLFTLFHSPDRKFAES